MATATRRLLELPPELLQLVARFAYPNYTGFAFAARATMRATAEPLGLDSIFAICAHAALHKIARFECPQARLLMRLQLVKRAMAAGNDAELFVWAPEALDGPLPSPLRVHSSGPLRPDARTLPLEHNLQVGLDHPDPTGEYKGRFSIDILQLTTRDGGDVELPRPAWCEWWSSQYFIEDVAKTMSGVHMRVGNDIDVHMHGVHAHVLDISNANARSMRHYFLSKSCLRRMAIRLRPNAF